MAKAHRMIPVREEDWPLQACRVSTGELTEESEVWINKVGTFGVGSAAYWFGRVMSVAVRVVHYLLGSRHALWLLMYADDGLFVASGPSFAERILAGLLVLEALRVPLEAEFKPGSRFLILLEKLMDFKLLVAFGARDFEVFWPERLTDTWKGRAGQR